MDYLSAKFIIFCLPRSRSAWLSHFLSFDGKSCGHDLAVSSDNLDDLCSRIEGVSGTIETGAILGQKALRNRFPDAKIVVLRRQTDEVIASLNRLSVPFDQQDIIHKSHLLDELSAETGVYMVPYKSLDSEAVCEWLFRYCLEIPHDHRWWEVVRRINIQIDMAARLQQLQERHAIIEAMKAEAA